MFRKVDVTKFIYRNINIKYWSSLDLLWAVSIQSFDCFHGYSINMKVVLVKDKLSRNAILLEGSYTYKFLNSLASSLKKNKYPSNSKIVCDTWKFR